MKETYYNIPGAPGIALLSDLHNHPFQIIEQSLKRHQPELICIAGDIIYGRRPEDNRSPLDMQEFVLPFLRSCSAVAPSFLSLGNHEQILDGEDLEKIRSTGVVLLDNSWVMHAHTIIGGLTSGHVIDYRRYVSQLSSGERADARYPAKNTGGLGSHAGNDPEIAWLESFAAQEGFKILISHHPEYYPLIPENIDLILCGHAHGGQFRIFDHGLFAPGQGWWPKWTHGVYEGRMVVSAGLSNTAHVPRLFNPTEIVYINV